MDGPAGVVVGEDGVAAGGGRILGDCLNPVAAFR